ncbi:hypothetical protein [Streptomyces fulvorobeus]|uniref:Uncharacterized protein n=1 Tax=Streptomyces fulvorobeus TaxID=284028 RepID=A0A7J0CET3_9ACTN|nr:hypothetical protein [Streptomyces fulvorobeus]NYE44479.1 hypothetical protein [Streptomyces fulvorobeus]GFN01011.1 hypothetical protein Sfulv_58210 [Streptomyces fulvorobeus]
MRLYAQTPARRSRQLLADLIAAALIYAAVRLALAVRDAIMLLADPGRKAEGAGTSLSKGLGDAGDAASKVPFVGDQLQKPLRSAAEAGNGLADAGRSLQDAVSHLATLTTVALIAIPVVFVLLLWLPPRLRWIRRSGVTRRITEGPGGADLLALRVLTGPPRDLAALPVPPGGFAAAWRRGDEQVIADLAAIGLRKAGLRA